MEQTKGRILCVDDDRDTCEMMTALLGLTGYEISLALNVAEGLRSAKKDGFDLILLDWTFDDGTGLELCQMIRSFDAHTPILFYTGLSYGSEMKKALSAGAQGFFVKPLGMDDLLQTVSHLVRKDSSAGSPAD